MSSNVYKRIKHEKQTFAALNPEAFQIQSWRGRRIWDRTCYDIAFRNNTIPRDVSALMTRNIMTKSIAASESYKQIAENAANNGLNQILSELNNDQKI